MSCLGAHQGGWVETNPITNGFIGRHPNCKKYIFLSTVSTATGLTSMHYLRNGFHGKCTSDAANPDSLYNRIAEKRGISRDPERCREAMDLFGMLEWPYGASVVKGNVNFLTWKVPKVKP